MCQGLDKYWIFSCAVLSPQSCPTLCNPRDCSPPGFSVHGDSPGKDTGVGCHALFQGNLPNTGIEHRSPTLQADSLPVEPHRKPKRKQVQVNVNRYTGEGKNRIVIKFSRPEILHIIKQKYMLDFRMWYNCYGASEVVLMVKNPICQRRRQETLFDSWVRKIPLEEGTATHSSILAWRIP